MLFEGYRLRTVVLEINFSILGGLHLVFYLFSISGQYCLNYRQVLKVLGEAVRATGSSNSSGAT
jgi:hypothetical protein